MKLKELVDLPIHRCHLPISNVEIQFRAFTVGEQRNLLQAQQDGSESAITDAIIQIIDKCTFQKIKLDILPTTDVEVLLMHLRAQSVGSEIESTTKCQSCGETTKLMFDALNFRLTEAVSCDNPIQLGDDLWVQMRQPSLEDALAAKNKDELATVARCVVAVIKGDEIYEASQQPHQDVIEFIEALSGHQQQSIKKFFDSIPQLYIPIQFKCPHCGAETAIEIKGLSDVFT